MTTQASSALKHERWKHERWLLRVLLGPSALYLLLFFVLPLLSVVVYSFLTRGTYGQIVWTFTLENYARVVDPLYLQILWRSVVIAAINTVICLLLSYPFAYAIARMENVRARSILLI